MGPRRWVVVSISAATLTAGAVAMMVIATGLVGHASPPVTTPPAAAPAVLTLAQMASAPSTAPPSVAADPRALPSRSALVSPSATKPRTVKATPKSSPKAPVGNLASRLKTLPAATTQVIIVHATSASTTTATLETYQKVKGAWVPKFAAMSARVGADGLSDHHVEGTPNTPTGVYGFDSTFYGIDSDPGVHYGYHRLVANDWWDENSSSPTYNTFVHATTSPGGPSEALWEQTTAYRYFAVIAYNENPVVAGRGSGVFLHVGTGNSTAGCVSLAQGNLIKVLTWLNPSTKPRIVISTDANLHKY